MWPLDAPAVYTKYTLRVTGRVHRPCRASDKREPEAIAAGRDAQGPPKVQGQPRFGERMDNHGSTCVIGVVVLCLLSGHS